jgi:hypothetical protein
MSIQKNQKTYKKLLPAGVQVIIEVGGDMFNILKSDARLLIEFDESNRFEEVPEGATAKFSTPYQRVKLISAIEQSVVVVLGYGDFSTPSTQTVESVSATLESPNQSVISSVSLSGATVATLAGADNSNREVVVSVPSDSDTSVLLSQSAAAIGSGFILEAGQMIAIATKAGVYAQSLSGATVRLNTIINRVI